MAVAILAPLPSDIVQSPVSVTTAYEFASGSFTITSTVTGGLLPATSGTLTGSGVFTGSVSTASTGPASATSDASPSSGGSNTVTGFSISNTPPIIIETVIPLPPPPPPLGMKAAASALANKKYDVKGSIKNTGITSVNYRVLEVDLTVNPPQWNVVVPYTAATITGNKFRADNIPVTPVAGRYYSVQAVGYDRNGNLVGQFSMPMPK